MNLMSIERLAAELCEGAVRRTVCPECLGGKTGERSFDIGRANGHVWWICHRASCDVKGRTGGKGLPLKREQTVALDRIRPYEGRLFGLEIPDLDYFAARFGVLVNSAWVQATEDDEYALAIRGPDKQLRGYVIRQPLWAGLPEPIRKGQPDRPKAKTYMHKPEPVQSWYYPASGQMLYQSIVLVEDQVSAMKVAEAGQIGVALLGTHLDASKVRELARLERPIIVALDPDAQGTAQQLRRKWQGYFCRMRIVALEADPKDMDLVDLKEELC